MTPSRPYLLRAFYEWIADNALTAYIVVDAEIPGVDVPSQYVEDGRIVLNIAPGAVRDLSLENDHLSFQARFSGIPHTIFVPMKAITAVYAKENGRGMVFKEEDFEEEDPPPSGGSGSGRLKSVSTGSPAKKGGSGKGRANLTVVK